MVWGFNNKTGNIQTIVSLSENELRLFLIENNPGNLRTISSHKAAYNSSEVLQDECLKWFRDNKCKGLHCHWLLSRKLYKTINIKPPEVPDSEISTAVKWLIKDQIEQPLESLLTAHYKPYNQDQESEKLTVVVSEKSLIENLIAITKESGLQLESIQINELTPASGLAALKKLKPTSKDPNENKITGFIDEDELGLIYNFYAGSTFAFTRHIKGRFFPNVIEGEFSLESDNRQTQLDQFLLETQRTLDYCISQIFRRPVDSLVLDASKTTDLELIAALEQITELPISRVKFSQAPPQTLDEITVENIAPVLSLTEIGVVFSQANSQTQSVNFYLNQYKPKPLEFGFKFASSMAAAFMLSFFGFGYIQNQQLAQLNQQLSDNQSELTKIQFIIKKLQKQREKKQSPENIEKRILRKQKELISSKKLLAKVINKKPTKPVSYSSVLSALSQQKINSLWLTKIDLYPETINLTGQTTNPSSIPNYISSMSDNEVLNSEFKEFKIERDENDSRIVNFSMNSGRYKNAN